MISLDISRIPAVRFLGGSSTLIWGSESLSGSFLTQTIDKSEVNRNLRWICPETIFYRSTSFINEPGYSSQDPGEPFLHCPREIFYQTVGKRICVGGDLVFVRGITGELVEKFDNQNTDGYKEKHRKAFEEFLKKNKECIIEYEEFEDEYPPLDEFGNVNKISWLREYAMYAEEFSRRNNVDVFLNLEWKKSEADFPAPFWGIFDRIYKFERKYKNVIKVTQLR